MNEENFHDTWLQEDVESKEKERAKMNKQAKEDWTNCGKIEAKGERVLIWIRDFEAFGTSSVVENVEISAEFSLCALASPPVVPVVTVPSWM